jgi:hypothetical protein
MLSLFAILLAPIASSSRASLAVAGLLPDASLSHFATVSNCSTFDAELARYTEIYGIAPGSQPAAGNAGGLAARNKQNLSSGGSGNGTYMALDAATGTRRPTRLLAAAGGGRIAFLDLNEKTYLEFLCADESPSWWREVFVDQRGLNVHHMGYRTPQGAPVWDIVSNFSRAGLGTPVQWDRFDATQHTKPQGFIIRPPLLTTNKVF